MLSTPVANSNRPEPTSSRTASRSIDFDGPAHRRPREQPRDHRPELRQQHRNRDQADRDVRSLAERIRPRRGSRWQRDQRPDVALRPDRRVVAADHVRLIGGVRDQAGDRHDGDQHQQDRAEHRGQPRPAQRAAPESRPKRAGRWPWQRRRFDRGQTRQPRRLHATDRSTALMSRTARRLPLTLPDTFDSPPARGP